MAPSPLALDLVFAWVSDVSEFWDGQGLRPCVKLDSGACLEQAMHAADAVSKAMRAASAAGSYCRSTLPLCRAMASKANMERAMAVENLEASATDELLRYQEWAQMAALGL